MTKFWDKNSAFRFLVKIVVTSLPSLNPHHRSHGCHSFHFAGKDAPPPPTLARETLCRKFMQIFMSRDCLPLQLHFEVWNICCLAFDMPLAWAIPWPRTFPKLTYPTINPHYLINWVLLQHLSTCFLTLVSFHLSFQGYSVKKMFKV